MGTRVLSCFRTLLALSVVGIALSLVCGFSWATTAYAATGDPASHTQAQIRSFVNSKNIDFSTATTYSSTPSATSPYAAGSVDSKSLNNALNALNTMRYIAGVDSDVTLNGSYSSYAQAAALTNAANNELSHTPTQPSGMDSSLYSKGKTGAQYSNLAKGYGNLASSILGYMEDSDSSNISEVGHRRWLLSPKMKQTGFGQVNKYSATYVRDQTRTSSVSKIAWPAANMPTSFFGKNYAWSFEYKSSEFGAASSMSVTVVRTSDNKSWSFSSGSSNYWTSYANSAMYGGLDAAVIFQLSGVEYSAGDKYTVTVKGSKKSYTYTVNFFDLYPLDQVTLYDCGESYKTDEVALENGSTLTVSLGQTKRKLYAIPGYSTATTSNAKALAKANNNKYETKWTSSNPSVASVAAAGTKDSSSKFSFNGGYYAEDHIGLMTLKSIGTTKITATINGVSQTITLKVTAADLSKAKSSGSVSSVTYNGKAQTPTAPALTYTFIDQYGYTTKETLVAGTDYTVSYRSNTNAGTASIVYTGKGRFAGTFTKTFTINKATPSYTAPTGLTAAYGQTLKDVALPSGFSWNSPSTSVGALGSKTFKAKYTPSDTTNYNTVSNISVGVTVKAASISKSMLTVDTSASTYTGKAITKNVSSSSLKNGTDYSVAYKNNVNAGTATITITGKGNYQGSLAYTFAINKANPSYTAPTGLTATVGDKLSSVKLPSGFSWNSPSTTLSSTGAKTYKATYTPSDTANYNTISDVSISVQVNAAKTTISKSMLTVDTSASTYTGKAITKNVSSSSLKNGTDYSVAYKNNVNAGTATITITGKGNYQGSLTYTFAINKANPSYTVPTGLTATVGDKLSSVKLPSGFSWSSPSTTLSSTGAKTYKATYTPSDTANYNTVSNINVTVTVSAKQSTTINTMYRLYNPNSGEHFYTASANERDSVARAGWNYEGIGWYAPSTSSTPVYRLYSGTDHHYTTDAGERDYLVKVGWKYEGIGWYSDDAEGVPLYRQFNPNVNPKAKYNNSGSHNYTTSKAENDQLVKAGWREEGIGWYGVKR